MGVITGYTVRLTRVIMGTQDIQRMTRVNMGTQDRQGQTWVSRNNKGIQYGYGKHGFTGYIGVYRAYSTTRVNVGSNDI